LLPVLPYDRSRGFEADADGAAFIDKGTLRGDPPDDILEIDICRAAQLMLKRYGDKALEESAARADELWPLGQNRAATWRPSIGG
jgi:hypothetical protein